MTEVGSNVLSFGDVLESPLAAKLKDMGIPQSVSRATTERLGGVLEGIGASWSNLTFNNPNKKNEAMPTLRDEWAILTEITTLDTEERWVVLNRFVRGLRLRGGRVTRTQLEHTAAKGAAGAMLKRNHPVEQFLDGVDPKIKFLPAPYIVLESVLELSGYPNPSLDSLQEFLAESYRRGQLGCGPKRWVELPEFLSALNNWIPTLNGQAK